ncbi:MAG: Ldh family oxidoreductase [bacterium]|nr:Ldh family oxidoreductase [bacterium]
MNLPPEASVRVPHEAMQAFVSEAGQSVGLPEEKANLLARLLVENDLRGIFSHGTRQIARYAIWLRDGKLNPKSNVTVVKETPVSLLLDGDGGLGYFPAYEGTLRIVEKAKETGMAVLVSRNHGHFGAAGIYARLTLGHDLLTLVTQGFKLDLKPGMPFYEAIGGAPWAFSAPAGEDDSVVLDFRAKHDLFANSPHREAITQMAPGIVFRSIGLGAICQAWGGFLAEAPTHTGSGGDPKLMGALVMAFRIDLFSDPDRFKREMDDYVRQVRALAPLDGFDEAYLPGGPEAARERVYRESGIPVGPEHQTRLEKLGTELGIAVPW